MAGWRRQRGAVLSDLGSEQMRNKTRHGNPDINISDEPVSITYNPINS